jgi:hypothetical protein
MVNGWARIAGNHCRRWRGGAFPFGMMASKTRVPVVVHRATNAHPALTARIQSANATWFPAAMAIGASCGSVNAGLMAAGALGAARCRCCNALTNGAAIFSPHPDEPTNDQHNDDRYFGASLGVWLSVVASRLGLKTHIYDPGTTSPAAR